MDRAGDLELVARLVSADAEAGSRFHDLLRDVAAHVAARARRTWRGLPVDADDLAHTVHVKLFENDARTLRSFDGRSSLRTWLGTVVGRTCCEQLSGDARRQRRTAPGEDVGAIGSDAPPADDAVQRAQDADLARRAVSRLPPEDRALYELLFVHDADTTTVAAGLGITPDGVRMRKMRLLRRLREVVAELAPDRLPGAGVTSGARAPTQDSRVAHE